MLKIKTDELRDTVESFLANEDTMFFLGDVNSGKTTVAKELVDILSKSRTVGFVTEDAIEGTLTNIEDAIGEAKQPEVWVIDVPLHLGKKEELEDTGAKLVWFTTRRRVSIDDKDALTFEPSITVENALVDADEAFNVEYFVTK